MKYGEKKTSTFSHFFVHCWLKVWVRWNDIRLKIFVIHKLVFCSTKLEGWNSTMERCWSVFIRKIRWDAKGKKKSFQVLFSINCKWIISALTGINEACSAPASHEFYSDETGCERWETTVNLRYDLVNGQK